MKVRDVVNNVRYLQWENLCIKKDLKKLPRNALAARQILQSKIDYNNHIIEESDKLIREEYKKYYGKEMPSVEEWKNGTYKN